MTEHKFDVVSSMVDVNRKLSVPSIFRLFQDVAMSDADKVGYGKRQTIDRGWLWVFTRIYLEIDELPFYESTANFITYPNGSRGGFLFNRQALINANNKILVRIASQWAIMDATTRKLVLKPNFEDVDESNKFVPLVMPDKTSQACETQFLYSRKIRYSDCDLNSHLNNVRYVDFIVDINDSKFYEKYRIYHLLINYKHEVHDNDELYIYVNRDKSYVEGKINNNVCFNAFIEYKQIKN